MKLCLLQILVVVANTQVKLLRTEEETGFMRTEFDHELVGPKVTTNLKKKIHEEIHYKMYLSLRKGKCLILHY